MVDQKIVWVIERCEDEFYKGGSGEWTDDVYDAKRFHSLSEIELFVETMFTPWAYPLAVCAVKLAYEEVNCGCSR